MTGEARTNTRPLSDHQPRSSLGLPDALRRALVVGADVETVLHALCDAVCAMTDATVAAVLRLDPDGRSVVEHDHGSDLVDVDIDADGFRVPLSSLPPGEEGLRWSRPVDAPTPLAGRASWASGVVVVVPTGSEPVRLLAVGSPEECARGPAGDEAAPGDSETAALVCALASLAAPTLRSVELDLAATRARALLERVTDLAIRLTGADDPEGLLAALVQGLAAIDVVDAATVWRADEDGMPIIEEQSHPAVVRALDEAACLRVGAMLAPTVASAAVGELAHVDHLPDGRLLTLLPVGKTRRRVLGLVHSRALDADERGVFTTLVGALGPALRQAEMAVERTTLVSTFGRVLRPHSIPSGVDIGVEHHPNTTAAETFGGDFYDWFSPAAGRVLLALGDVSGKGIPAAAASSMAVWSLRTIGRQGTGPSMIARLMDTAVADELGADRFVTLALVDIDLQTWRSRMVLAGHPAPLVLPARPGESPPAADRPLGVMPDGAAFTTHDLHLDPGQALVLFTDGVTDGRNADGERLGRERLEVIAAEVSAAADDATTLAAGLWRGVREWVGGAPDDDCAILALRRPSAG